MTCTTFVTSPPVSPPVRQRVRLSVCQGRHFQCHFTVYVLQSKMTSSSCCQVRRLDGQFDRPSTTPSRQSIVTLSAGLLRGSTNTLSACRQMIGLLLSSINDEHWLALYEPTVQRGRATFDTTFWSRHRLPCRASTSSPHRSGAMPQDGLASVSPQGAAMVSSPSPTNCRTLCVLWYGVCSGQWRRRLDVQSTFYIDPYGA